MHRDIVRNCVCCFSWANLKNHGIRFYPLSIPNEALSNHKLITAGPQRLVPIGEINAVSTILVAGLHNKWRTTSGGRLFLGGPHALLSLIAIGNRISVPEQLRTKLVIGIKFVPNCDVLRRILSKEQLETDPVLLRIRPR